MIGTSWSPERFEITDFKKKKTLIRLYLKKRGQKLKSVEGCFKAYQIKIKNPQNVIIFQMRHTLLMLSDRNVQSKQGLNKTGPRANGPQNCLRARKFWGDSNTVISAINEVRESGSLKDCEGPQKYDIKGLNDP